MATLMASAFAAMSTTAAAAAPAAAATATTAAASGAAMTSGALTSLQTVATIASMASTLVGGFAAMREGETQAKFAGLQAEGERLAAEERAIGIRREYLEKSAANRAAFAGSGLDISSGDAIDGALASAAEREQQQALAGGALAAAGSRAQAASLKGRGLSSMIAAGGRAAGQIADFKIDLTRRG